MLWVCSRAGFHTRATQPMVPVGSNWSLGAGSFGLTGEEIMNILSKWSRNCLLSSFFCLAAIFSMAGCASDGPGGDDQKCEVNYQGDCEATKESGLLLKEFGKYDVVSAVGTPTPVRAMVIQLADENCEGGGAAEGVEVDFYIITPNAEAVLSQSTYTTGPDGVAKVDFVADKPGQYQIAAEAEGTCVVTFTVDVSDAYQGLKPVGSDTVNAWTRTQVTLSAKAYTLVPGTGEYPLPAQTVTFELGGGGSGAILSTLNQSSEGSSVDVTTGGNGIATVHLRTGSVAVPNGLLVSATLEGTQPVEFTVYVNEYSDEPCETNIDCPADFPICENGLCIEHTVPSTGCETNDDCVPPYECVQFGDSKMCVKPDTTGDRCDPIEGMDCPPDEVCIGGYCTPEPSSIECEDNDDCPNGFVCIDGTCQPDPNDPDPPCVTDEDCTGDLVCVSGVCTDPDGCNPLPNPTRLQGNWSFDSRLHLRDALSGWLSAFLSATEVLRDIILGNLDLGLPGWIESLIEGVLSSLIDAYVPPWAQELIVGLGDLSDILDDMRVLHTVQLIGAGNYEYMGTSTWDLLEFEFRGQTISEQPQNIPQIGHVPTYTFTSREVCHVFFIDKHEIENVVSGLIRWVIDAMVTAVTCSVPGWTCYYSLEEALYDIVNCDDIAYAIDDYVYDAFGLDVYDIVYQSCSAAKDPAINAIIDYLDQLETSFSVLTMRGRADIINDSRLGNPPSNPGRWWGTLAGGNWDGEFSAVKQ